MLWNNGYCEIACGDMIAKWIYGKLAITFVSSIPNFPNRWKQNIVTS